MLELVFGFVSELMCLALSNDPDRRVFSDER